MLGRFIVVLEAALYISPGNTENFYPTFDIVTPVGMNRILARGDINGDGLLDLVLGGWTGAVETMAPLTIAYGKAGGGFAIDSSAFLGTERKFMQPHIQLGDFTGDGKVDLAVFDAGYYDWSIRKTMGREPVLFVADANGKFSATSAFTDALAPLVVPSTGAGPASQVNLTMGVKDISSADIDGDGDLDLWIESTGSNNITSHFLINDHGKFTVDLDVRVARSTLFGPAQGDYWRYGDSAFADVNGDGAPDLIIGQIRDNDPTHLTQSSFVLINDGRGYFPQTRVAALPQPAFYHGYTAARFGGSWDMNGDGLKDIVMLHTRNDDVSGPEMETAWTGMYIQFLQQQPNGQFIDVTAQRIPDQGAWSGTHPNGDAISAQPFDVNRDGIMDLVIGYNYSRPGTTSPVILMGSADGRFTPADQAIITGGDQYFGDAAIAADLNNDGYLDFVHIDPLPGANGVYDNGSAQSDDNSAIITQLGLNPVGGGAPATAPLTRYGSANADTLSGNAGRDKLHGLGGNDTLNGGADLDTAIYTGARAGYTVSKNGSGFTVRDLSGAEGTDTLFAVERLVFSDRAVALDVGSDGIAGKAYRIYQAAFARTPDADGVGYWISLMDKGVSLATVAQGFITSGEYIAAYGSNLSNRDLVSKYYENILHRAPEQAGLDFWTGVLDSKGATLAEVLAAISESGENVSGTAAVIGNGFDYTPYG